MARPAGGYFTKAGERIPSVTTIIGKFRDPGALMWWAAGQTAEYIIKAVSEEPTKTEVLKLCDAGRTAFRDVRDEAASAGTMAHAAVEAWVKGEVFEFIGTPSVVEKARTAFGAFLEWAEQTNLEITHSEISLVSEAHRFGGTMDGVLFRRKRGAADWKSSTGIHAEYLIQVAAYGLLWRENFPEEPMDGGYHLVKFDRNAGDFTHKWWGNLDEAEKAFLLMRELYDIGRQLEKRVK